MYNRRKYINYLEGVIIYVCVLCIRMCICVNNHRLLMFTCYATFYAFGFHIYIVRLFTRLIGLIVT